MSKWFDVRDSDLCELERILPELLSESSTTLTNGQKVQWRKVQDIINKIRWGYGPLTFVEEYTGEKVDDYT